MFTNVACGVVNLLKTYKKLIIVIVIIIAVAMAITFAIGKIYQNWDDDPDRGAIGIVGGNFNESYDTPVYLDQGWDESESLWFYNTTQGSNLIPYDFFMALEQADSRTLFRDNTLFDKYRYIPQKATFFNPDGLAIGFVKDTYQGKDYIGYTCAACHTGQVNYKGKAIRIDGGPAMADMVGYLESMQKAMEQTLKSPDKFRRFSQGVINRNNDYDSEEVIRQDLEKWTKTIVLYNTVNHTNVNYGYARLDAFGRIYNRVLEHVINREQARTLMLMTLKPSTHQRLLTRAEVDKVLEGINETIIGNEQFAIILDRLQQKTNGYPGLSPRELLLIRNALFNEPDAPVSYPFLWDIAQSDFVQWNGIAANAGVGPLGRNTGEVIGVFGTLDWTAQDPGFSLSAKLTGQENQQKRVDFKSSIDLVNLERLEAHLRLLKSPQWPEDILGKIDRRKAERGQLIYAEYCQSCHEVIDRNNYDRKVIAQMSDIDIVGTDPQMAVNSVSYTGKSGNFKHTYQERDGVGKLLLPEDAPVAMILTSVTTGVVATPDPDKIFIRRWLDWLYTLGLSFFTNDIKETVRVGQYRPDTTSAPFQSLLAYKGRPLNGIWATAPYLHNGSVPTLYDLLLPVKRADDPEDGEYRPTEFRVGSREFNPTKIGFRTDGYDGFKFVTDTLGDYNIGHEYAAGKTPLPNGETLPPLTKEERWDLIEFIKTL